MNENIFNYTKIHLFDKTGSELPLVYDPAMIIQIPNTYNDDALFYAISDVNHNICEFYKKSSGGRFHIEDFLDTTFSADGIIATAGCYIIIEGKKEKGKVTVLLQEAVSNLSKESGIHEYIVKDILPLSDSRQVLKDYLDLSIVGFPFATFKSSLAIDPVSVDLVETQSLYILIDENDEFKKFSDSNTPTTLDWARRYQLLFFIDNRQQNNFRFFKVEADQAIWTDRIFCNLLNTNEQTAYRVDIGFIGEEEGVYEQQLVVCLLDTECEEDEKPGIIYPIGSINLTCEAIGEDERYRALFANFGIPDPITYQDTFQDTDLNEGKIDYKSLNEHSKYIFLTYKDTFPKASSYGALAKGVSLLGYEDLIFKEWYKELGKTTDNEYITFEVDPKKSRGGFNDNSINNEPIEERIGLKKLNWLSIVYKLNEFLNENTVEDKYGFFELRNIHRNYNSDIVAKLILLKKWLEKYIIGLHCKIVDVGGEGIYLERYRIAPYGTYQQVLEWNNSRNLAPFIEKQYEANADFGGIDYTLIDSSVDLLVNVGTKEPNTLIEDISNYRIGDFCNGYFDSDSTFHPMHKGVDKLKDAIFFGATFDEFNRFEKYEIRAESKCSSFMFNYDYLTEDSARLRVFNDELQFNPIDLLDKKKQSIFNRLPIIQLEKANIRKMNSSWKSSTLYKIYPDYENDTLTSYFVKNTKTGKKKSTVDYVTLVPPEFREDDTYSYITPFGQKEFKFKHTFIPTVTSDNVNEDLEEVPYKLYERNNNTHGLRYTAMNAYEVPLLCMIGYVCPELEGFIRADQEYCLEILDGKLIFQDPDNSRTIYLNFHFDTESNHQSVELNIVYYSAEYSNMRYLNDEIADSAYTYKTDYPTNTKFFVGTSYPSFITQYKEDPTKCIFFDKVFPITVNNSGEFEVSVFARDIHNNLFGAKCANTVTVQFPEVFIDGYYGEGKSANYTFASIDEIQRLNDEYLKFCIFKPDYLIHDISKTLIEKDGSKYVKFSYPSYSYSSHNANPGDFLHFMNLSDRYLANAIDIKEYLVKNDEDFAEYNMIFQKYTPVPAQRVIENNDQQALTIMNNNSIIPVDTSSLPLSKPVSSTNFIKTIREDEEYNFTDINFILYNELSNAVILQTPGNMINDKAIPYVDSKIAEHSALKYIPFYKDQYRLFLGDDSYKSYIWAILEDTSELSIPKYLSSYAYLEINNDQDVPYAIDTTSEEPETCDEMIETFGDDNLVLFKTSEFLIDLFENNAGILLPSSDASINGWNIGDYVNNLDASIYEILDSSYEGIELIKNGINLTIDSSLTDSSISFNPYFEIKTNLISQNYKAVKEIAINQIYNIFAREVIHENDKDVDVIDEFITYELINKDVLGSFEINDSVTHFHNQYLISYDIVGDPIDRNYSKFLLEDAIRTMQEFYTDEYLTKAAIEGVIDALNINESDTSVGTICENIFTNILNNFNLIESNSFSNVKNIIMRTDASTSERYSVYDEVINAVSDSSNNLTIGSFANGLYTVEHNEGDTPRNIPDPNNNLSAKLQELTASIYTMFIEGDDQILSDPDNYAKYYSCIAYITYCYLGLVIADYIYNNGVLKLDHFDTIDEEDVPVYTDNINTNIPNKSKNVDNIFVQYASSELLAVQNKSYVLTTAFLKGILSFIFGQYNNDSSTYDATIISELLQEEYVIEDSSTYVPLYEKLVNNLISYDIDYLEEINWVTTISYSEERKQNVHLYAVAASDPLDFSNLYYAKRPGYEREGYIFVNSKMSSGNSVGNLETILDLPYITTYVQPTWRAKVVIIILSNKTAKNLGYTVDKNADPDDYSDYLAIEYYSDKFTYAFRTGEIIKLIFESSENSEYIGQSSYEVVGYDIANKFVIVKGAINPAYIRKTGYDVWAKVKECEDSSKGYVNLVNQLDSEFVGYKEDIDKLVMSSMTPSDDQQDDEMISTFASIPSKEILKTFTYIEGYDYSYDENDNLLYEPLYDASGNMIYDNHGEFVYDASSHLVFKGNLFELLYPDSSVDSSVKDSSIYEKIYDTYGLMVYDSFGNFVYKVEPQPIKTAKYRTIPYSLSVKYWWADEDKEYYRNYDFDSEETEDNPKPRGTWFYKVMIYQNGRMYPVESSYTIADEMVNVYISYAHNAYVDYVLNAYDFVERSDGYTDVFVKYDGVDIRKCDFIDDTFALSIRDYDTNLGMKAWMNSTEISYKIYVPNILMTKVYNEDGEEFDVSYIDAGLENFVLFKSEMKGYDNTPRQIILNKKNTNVVFDVDLSKLVGFNEEDAVIFWKVYKQRLNGTIERMFESYNKTLYLDIDEIGTYDIEVFVTDKFGNVSRTYYTAAIKII